MNVLWPIHHVSLISLPYINIPFLPPTGTLAKDVQGSLKGAADKMTNVSMKGWYNLQSYLGYDTGGAQGNRSITNGSETSGAYQQQGSYGGAATNGSSYGGAATNGAKFEASNGAGGDSWGTDDGWGNNDGWASNNINTKTGWHIPLPSLSLLRSYKNFK